MPINAKPCGGTWYLEELLRIWQIAALLLEGLYLLSFMATRRPSGSPRRRRYSSSLFVVHWILNPLRERDRYIYLSLSLNATKAHGVRYVLRSRTVEHGDAIRSFFNKKVFEDLNTIQDNAPLRSLTSVTPQMAASDWSIGFINLLHQYIYQLTHQTSNRQHGKKTVWGIFEASSLTL